MDLIIIDGIGRLGEIASDTKLTAERRESLVVRAGSKGRHTRWLP
jgi:hypothetical protein